MSDCCLTAWNAVAPGWLAPLWATDQTRIALLLIVGAGLLYVLLPGKKTAQKSAQQAEKTLPVLGKPGPLTRVLHRPEKPVKAGGVTFDRAWRHVGIIATTGARKSTLLAHLADQLGVPCIVITGDHAPPLENWTRSVGGWVWTARGGVAWYPWAGPLESAVQRAEHMHPSTTGDVGVGRAMFKQAARVAWGAADDRGEVRTLAQLRAALPTVVKGQMSAMMAENWSARLLELEQSLGTSLGDQLDIVEALRQKTSVMVSLNSFQDTSNRGRFASIAVLEALRAADTLGNIGVIIDEVGLIGGDLFGDAVRTFRVRRVTGLFASQIAGDFPPEVRGNVNVWFLGQQSGGDKQSRQWSSDATFGLVPPEHFGEHVLPHGKFYVVHGGRVEQATIPTWKDRWIRPPMALPAHAVSRISTPIEQKVSGYGLPELAAGVPTDVLHGPVAMPEYWDGDKQLRNIWAHHVFPGGLNGCYESTYHTNNRGRPQCPYKNEDYSTYILSLALHDGLDLAKVRLLTAAGTLTVGHKCENKKCDRAEHLKWQDRGENTEEWFENRRREAGIGRSVAAD